MSDEPDRCRRCLVALQDAGYMMAGQRYCCQSCSVGSACEHQQIHRPASVRRLDSNFGPRFRKVVRHSSPYSRERVERE